MRKNKRKGFTIIELVVVAVILALMGGLVLPNILKKFGKAKHNIAKAKIKMIEQAVVEFKVDCGRLPYDSEGLESLITAPDDVADRWDGQYLKEKQLYDPWGNLYQYYEQGTVNPGSFDIVCYGADGAEGGEGENADIYNDE